MKKIVVLFILLTALVVPIASATTSELVWKEHPWLYKLGIGDKVYKVTYDDGSVIYQYVRGTFLKPGYINYMTSKIVVPVGGDPSGQVTFDVTFQGPSCKLSGGNRAYTDFIVFQTADTKETVGALTETVQCEQYYPKQISILTGGLGSRINTIGTYRINIIITTDLITMKVVEYKWVDLDVGGIYQTPIYQTPVQTAQPTPTPTTPPLPAGQCKDSYGNIFTCTTSTATATSTPSSSTGTGQISVSSNVQGDVYIDGSKVGTAGTTGTTFTATGGGHTVKVTQTGYNDYTTSVTVDSGRTSSVTATLTAASTSGDSKGGTAQGYIIVWSSPSEAKVYVNDVEKGTTGAQWLSVQMPVGAYTVKLVKGGYEAYSQSVTVVANDNVKVEARMTIISPPGDTSTGTSTGTPAATSGITIESKTTKGGYECPQGTVWNADRTGCIVPKKTIGEKIDQLPGFEAVFAIAGLVAVAYLVLRQKEKKKKKDDYEE